MSGIYQEIARGIIFFYTKALKLSANNGVIEEYDIEDLKNYPEITAFLKKGSVKVMGLMEVFY